MQLTHLELDERVYMMLVETFTWVNVPENLKVMDCWLEANPRRRPRNQKRFIVNWLKRQPKPKDVYVGQGPISPVSMNPRAIERYLNRGVKS